LRNRCAARPNQSLMKMNRKGTRKRATARVLTLSDASAAGEMRFGNMVFPAAIGKGGVRAMKREGDGASPRGIWPVGRAFYRADRLRRPRAAVPLEPLRPQSGWCDAPSDRNYNRRVRLPYRASAEKLWRDDGLYDLILVLDYNLTSRSRGRGSAIFVHFARPDFAPTAGCIALRREHLLRLLAALPRRAAFVLGKSVNRARRR
jgi:L,D-peptidoglycan transpeptidase YkuD (ErfK/YbiS/YcfS/YnhG family)